MASYRGKELKTFFTSQLEAILAGLQTALNERMEASKHPKFNDKSTKKYVGEFPPPNPEFLKLKLAIEEEIRKRKNA